MKILFSKKGFTLLELLVVLSIFAIMTALLVANQRKFGANINLSNLTYDVALSLRETQTYGLAFKGSGPKASDFSSSYGMHFDLTTPTAYTLFVDKGTSHVFDPTDEIARKYQLGNGISFSKFCTNSTAEDACSAQKLDITFTRPNPDATMKITKTDGTISLATEMYICLISNIEGRKKKIDVLASGQIAVQDVIAGATDPCN